MWRQYFNDDEEEKHEPVPSPAPANSQQTPTYNYSYMPADDGNGHTGVRDSAKNRQSQPRGSESVGGTRSSASTPTHGRESVFVRGTLGGRDIEALEMDKVPVPEQSKDYKGRYRMWPGLVFLILLLGAAGALATYYGIQAHSRSEKLAKAYEEEEFNATTITGGNTNTNSSTANKDIISDDGAIGNPKVYPASTCELPNYLSKNGHIVAVSSNGTEVPLKIKGINWFGMETGQAVPFGLWDNSNNGTTAYQVASFLSHNNFNAVRLPLMATWILENKVPNADLVNKQENRGLNLKDYLSLLKSIVKVLQYRNIAVLISMHTLTYSDNGKLWYNADVPEEKFLEAIDILTKTLCSMEYWNVMGIDVKNEPAGATWGDGSATDFNAGAKRIADRMLKGCPNWMGFVEGVNSKHTMSIGGETFSYYDWYGGGLQGAKDVGLEFAVKDKVVWAPHYYTPAVYPQQYFFGGGTIGSGLQGYVELDDDTLRARVKATMNDMFGFLASEKGPALLLGEFGGLYDTDLHPKKTTKRCTDYTIEVIKQPGWTGGFVWSLNPESEYQYNPTDTPGRFVEGVVQPDWLSANKGYLAGMAAMDDMENLQPFPCFPAKATSGSSSAAS